MTRYTQKLAAWLHDPAEKQLVLMRDPAGDEGSTSRYLHQVLDISSKAFDKRADHLAAAADCPNWPRGEDAKLYPQFESVSFSQEAELIHPLSGGRLCLSDLGMNIGVDSIKALNALSQCHFEDLIQEDDDRKTFLAFWRFGPEVSQKADQLGALWPMLPADSRTPDHSIWSHVDTVSAIHTALMGDDDGEDQPALLVMSFGPVQELMGQVRTTSDLWAGSHLLSCLVFEAMKPIINHLGPDVIVFPALRAVPVVDAWLLEEGGDAFKKLFNGINAEFLSEQDDTNPLFTANLPNKFMAIVPSRQAAALAIKATNAIRLAAVQWATQAAERVFKAAGIEMTDVTHAQIKAQLAGFPDACWAAATWPIDGDGCTDISTASTRLQTALGSIHPELKKQGIFKDDVWKVLTRELKLKNLHFWQPNTGILYPAVYELAERALGAAKATCPFEAIHQEGHRCTLTGEGEWLTDNRSLLGLNRTDRNNRSVWGKLAKAKPSWVQPGEHLSAIAALKRLWPMMFAEYVSQLTGGDVSRFVVSTHALALSTTLEKLATQPLTTDQQAALRALGAVAKDHDPVALPKALERQLNRLPQATVDVLKRLPSMMEQDVDNSHLNKTIAQLLGDSRPETYYAMILMNGDHMGSWLAGNEDDYKLAYRDTWHTKVLSEMQVFERLDPQLKTYLNTKRPASLGRHMAISQALNDFSTRLARHVVEKCCNGKLLYAGGDDVMALVAVDDLVDCMQLLRLAYSGIAPDDSMGLSNSIGTLRKGAQSKLLLSRGFGLHNGRLMTLMGHKATASMGAVVAHHSAPMGWVLRELRLAESTAKNTTHGKNGKGVNMNRDAFCLRVLKRGGGEVNVTSPWWPVLADQQPDPSQSGLAIIKQLAQQLALTDFSREAIYQTHLWFDGLTDEAADAQNPRWREQMASSLSQQFHRQKGRKEVARSVVNFVCHVMQPQHPRTAIENFLVTSEFFAREMRSFRQEPTDVRGVTP